MGPKYTPETLHRGRQMWALIAIFVVAAVVGLLIVAVA